MVTSFVSKLAILPVTKAHAYSERTAENRNKHLSKTEKNI